MPNFVRSLGEKLLVRLGLREEPSGGDLQTQPGDELLRWRERLVDAVAWSGVLMGIPALAYIIALLVHEGCWGLVVVDLIGYTATIFLLVNRRAPFRFRALLVSCILYFFGVGVIVFKGPFSGGPPFLFSFVVITGALLGLRAALVALGLNFLTMIAAGVMLKMGLWPELEALGRTPTQWLASGITFLALNCVVTISVAWMLTGLEGSIRRAEQARRSLEEEVRRRAELEARLLERERWYRTTFEYTGTAMVLIAADSTMVMVNERFAQLCGYHKEELEGKRRWQEFVDPADLKRMEEYHHQRRKGGQPPTQYEFTFIDRHGNRRHVLNTVQMIPGTTYTVASLMDITERKEAAERLAASERRYRELVDNISDFIYTHDLEGRFLSVNRAVTRTLGYQVDELLGRSVTRIIPPEYHHDFFNRYLPEIQEKGQAAGLLVSLTKQGEQRFLEYRNQLVREEGGEPYVRGSARDVTEHILNRRQQRRLEEQLMQAQKMEALATLTGGVAHDFNNLLTSMLGNLELVSKGLPHDHPGRRYLDNAITAAQRAATVTKQLLTMSRKAERHLKPLDMAKVIRESVALVRETIDRRIEVSLDLPPNLPLVNADEAQMSQVIMNLLVNARDALMNRLSGAPEQEEQAHSPDSFHIRIQAREVTLRHEDIASSALAYPGRFLEITIADTGCGMEPEVLERIYEPFFTTKPTGQGTGLGLSTAYGIITQHQGWMEAESTPGEGSVFRLYLPVVQEEAKLGPQPAPVPAEPKGHEGILLVDDEEHILEMLSEALGSMGYRIFTARDGIEAVEVFQEHRDDIDLVVLDLVMPRMTGQQAMTRLLALKPGIKIIVSSGHSGNRRGDPLDLPPHAHFLAKPYSLDVLAVTVRKILDQD
jgi:PAS domain S-box-containing protein